MIDNRRDTMQQLHRHSTDACPRCLPLAFSDQMPIECVQPLPPFGIAPRTVEDGERCCFDCASTDTALKMLTRDRAKTNRYLYRARFRAGERGQHVPAGLTWDMLRIAVANDRSEQYRLPGVPMGMVMKGWVRPSYEGELEEHYTWLARVGLADSEPRRNRR